MGIRRGLRRVQAWLKAFWCVVFDQCRISYSQLAEDLMLRDFSEIAQFMGKMGYAFIAQGYLTTFFKRK